MQGDGMSLTKLKVAGPRLADLQALRGGLAARQRVCDSPCLLRAKWPRCGIPAILRYQALPNPAALSWCEGNGSCVIKSSAVTVVPEPATPPGRRSHLCPSTAPWSSDPASPGLRLPVAGSFLV